MMFAIAEKLSALAVLWARSKDGLSQDEAKKLFFQFRQKKNPEDTSDSQTEPPENRDPGRDNLSSQMTTFMRETSHKLDRIENDIDYLKNQVDLILKKI